MKLILASSSKYRRQMLDRLGLPFEIIAPGVDETPRKNETPFLLARRLSLAKAQAVAEQAQGEDWIVIGSDQTATMNNKTTIGKPGSHSSATSQLASASGKEMLFHSGLCVLRTMTQFSEVTSVEVSVKFKQLSAEQIENYLQLEKPYDCTGSAKIESLGIALVERVNCPDPTALVGLPLIALTDMLERAGLDVLNHHLS
jgi:septum formation protein